MVAGNFHSFQFLELAFSGLGLSARAQGEGLTPELLSGIWSTFPFLSPSSLLPEPALQTPGNHGNLSVNTGEATLTPKPY